MRAEYKRDVSHNYLILYGENPVDSSSYQVRMLTGNAVPSILKCRIQGLDGKILFYYDITSRQSLASFYEQKKLKVSDIRIIFSGFVKVMEEMAEFLLNADHLLLSPEYMYLDVEKQKLYFCCLPGEPRPVQEQFREMTEYFLPKLDHEDSAAVMMGYGIYRKALETGIQLEVIKELIYQNYNNQEEPEKAQEPEKSEKNSFQIEPLSEESEIDWKLEETKEQPSDKKKGIDERFLWIGGCGFGLAILLVLLGAGYLGYLPEIPIEMVLAAAIFLLGMSALGVWLSEKKKKKQDKTEAWRQKAKKEFARSQEDTAGSEAEQETVCQHEEKVPINRFTEESQEADYGETVVLSSGQVKGPSSLVSREPGELATIFLEQELTVIGKMENAADAVIPRATVSRVHARIRKSEEEYFLADLNSRNGTSVNGRMLKANEEYQLQDEDEVDFAEARYIFIR